MSTKNSSLVTNFEAVPQDANRSQELHGRQRVAQGTIALATTDIEAADVIMLAPIPSNASITSILIANDDLDSATTITHDVGLYDLDGVAEDDDVYASASTAFRAAAGLTEYRFTTANINTCGQMVWEDAGLSADDNKLHYLAITINAAGTTAGDISFIVTYVVD